MTVQEAPPPEEEGGFKGALTRRLGPFAVWQWALIVAGAYMSYRFFRTGSVFGGGQSSGAAVIGSSSDASGQQTVPGTDNTVTTVIEHNPANLTHTILYRITHLKVGSTYKFTWGSRKGATIKRLNVAHWRYCRGGKCRILSLSNILHLFSEYDYTAQPKPTTTSTTTVTTAAGSFITSPSTTQESSAAG